MVKVDVLRSLRLFCLDCQGESAQQVRLCADKHCALWLWRMGSRDEVAEGFCTSALEAGTEMNLMSADVPLAPAAEETKEARSLRRARQTRLALRAVRGQCLACAGDRKEVRLCAAKEHCALWSLRFGVRPETYKAVRKRFFAPKALTLF